MGELFCGPGGMAIASAQDVRICGRDRKEYRLEHAWGVDVSPYAIQTFKKNLGEKNGIQDDAWHFVNKCLDASKRINALAFGFPCNSFSQVGERRGVNDKKFGDLYKTGIKVIETYDPEWFIAENVSGIMGHDSGNQFKCILQDLANSGKGYNVVAHLYKFEEYGVPQSRHRYVIVGIRADIAKKRKLEFRPPAPEYGPKCARQYVTCKKALDKVKNETTWGSEKTRQSDTVVWRLKFTPPGENAWKLDELVNKELYPDNVLDDYLKKIPWYKKDIEAQFPIKNLHDRITAIRNKIEEVRLHCKKARMSHIYRRLDPRRPAYTLTGSGGGGTHIYHYSEHRALTNEERAALQTFPQDFVFCGGPEQIRKQIGMAVPTVGARKIFMAILKTFAKIDYKSVKPDPKLIYKPNKEQ